MEARITYEDRANWASVALTIFAHADTWLPAIRAMNGEACPPWPAEEVEEHAIDLIADLLHLVQSEGLDPNEMMRQAWTHYQAETA